MLAGHDYDHPQRQGVTEIRVMQDVASDLRPYQDGHDVDEAARQRVGRGVGSERVAEKKYESRQNGRHENGDAHLEPILKAGRAEAFSRLPPFFLHAVHGGSNYEDHERYLKVGIGEGETPEAVEVEARAVEIEAEYGPQQDSYETDPSKSGDEGEGQGHAGEI